MKLEVEDSSPKSLRKKHGFSLVELLTVITILALLTAATVAALPSILGARGLAKAVEDTTGMLELARSEAMARRTYVYVAFLNTNSFGNAEIRIAAVASLDGSTDTNAANLKPLTRAVKIERALMSADIPSAVSTLVSNPSFGMSNVTGLPGFKVDNVDFGGSHTGIIFSPNGEALAYATSMSFLPKVDIGFVATKGMTPQDHDGAVVRYLGGPGNILVFRP